MKSKSNDTPVCVIEDKQLITCPKQVCNSFNKYNCTIAENILNKRRYTGDGNFNKYMPKPHSSSLLFTGTNNDEVKC